MVEKKRLKAGAKLRKICAVICIIISFMCLLWCIFSSISNNSVSPYVKAVLTPNLKDGSVSFRGASIDGDWYNPMGIISENSCWIEDENDFRLMAMGAQPLVLQLPKGEVCKLVFDAGPQQGQVTITTENSVAEVNLYLDADAEYGLPYYIQCGALPRTVEDNNRIALLAVVSIMTLMLAVLCLGGVKRRRGLAARL